MKRIGLGIWLVTTVIMGYLLAIWYTNPEPIYRPDWGFWPLCWLIGSILIAFLVGILKDFFSDIDSSGMYSTLMIFFWPIMVFVTLGFSLYKLGKWMSDL